jgi:hypothetical protein
MNLATPHLSKPGAADFAAGIALTLAILNALWAAGGDLRKFVLAVAMVLPGAAAMANANLPSYHPNIWEKPYSPGHIAMEADPVGDLIDDAMDYYHAQQAKKAAANPANKPSADATNTSFVPGATQNVGANFLQLYLALAIEAPRTMLVVTLVAALWLPLSAAAAMFASARRNRNPVGWFMTAGVLSPPMAFLMLAILRPRPMAATLRPARRWALNFQA